MILILSISFLGSGHKAKDSPNSGIPTKNPNIYFLDKKNRKSYTVSGPTTLNTLAEKRSIARSTKDSFTFFEGVIEELLKTYIVIKVKIKGHSRGGVIAKNVYEKLKKSFSSNPKVDFLPPIYLDPYAGPLSRLLGSLRKTEENNAVVVYTVNEWRFRSPMEVEKAKIVIFTKVAHDRCQFLKPPKGVIQGTFYFCDNGNEDGILRNYKINERNFYNKFLNINKIKTVANIDYSALESLQKAYKAMTNERRDYVLKHMKKVDKSNIKDCLSYLLLASKVDNTGKRDEILFNRLSKIDENEVLNWKKEHKK